MAALSKDGRIVYHPAWNSRYSGWLIIDCGCCGGIEWGGEYPRECSRCGAGADIWWHEASKVFAQYPGGPFFGRGDLSDIERYGSKSC